MNAPSLKSSRLWEGNAFISRAQNYMHFFTNQCVGGDSPAQIVFSPVSVWRCGLSSFNSSYKILCARSLILLFQDSRTLLSQAVRTLVTQSAQAMASKVIASYSSWVLPPITLPKLLGRPTVSV